MVMESKEFQASTLSKAESAPSHRERKMSDGPRTLGPIEKAAGASTGIGLHLDNEGRSSMVVTVAYVNEDSPFAGQLKEADEILEVNGVPVKGDAKAAAQAIKLAAPTLSIKIQTPSRMLGVMKLGKR